ncbi:uncharacterized protein KY384_008311 [Bacidia gigantensis]|uniref:uncharacterized protein n=1 Tax=Bacidia gigantensis TaxID=2732470 RepID=UPI001D04E340|nr:uncharacterized protein KY384_008311 [Bacidia gigantensis]KAG8526882.1 hypothetical protein KY384_008311 [Bacidia gigantensis]
MSGYLNPNPEDPQDLYYQTQGTYATSRGRTNTPSGYSQQTHWETTTYPDMSQSASHSFAAPSQYVSWPNTYPQLGTPDYPQSHYSQSSAPIVPSSPYAAQPWPNAPWPALHPDDVEAPSDNSRSTSPNPGDLASFGILLPDGRSWRCSYRGCTSQATFTRDATCASTIDGIQSPCSVDMKTVRSRVKAAFHRIRIGNVTSNGMLQQYRALSKAVKEFSAELTT